MLFLINQFGREATLEKPTYGAYNPNTGSVSSSGNPDTYTVKVYFSEFSLSEINNDSIVAGDRKALMPSQDTLGNTLPKPDVEDTITGVGDGVVIKKVQELYSAEDLVCYICHVRE